MRIEQSLDRWIIVCGTGKRKSYFSFFVDDDRSSWTRVHPAQSDKFETEAGARRALGDLRTRSALRRKRRLEAGK